MYSYFDSKPKPSRLMAKTALVFVTSPAVTVTDITSSTLDGSPACGLARALWPFPPVNRPWSSTLASASVQPQLKGWETRLANALLERNPLHVGSLRSVKPLML